MTILTKSNAFIQIKKDMAKCPITDETIIVEEEPEKVETYTPKRHACSGLSLALMAILLSAAGIYAGMYLFRRCLQHQPRYQGFCTIPIDTKQLQESSMMEQNYRMRPLRWTTTLDSETPMQVFADDPSPDEVANFLREELDIGDEIEKITVFENGRQTSFIHDFGNNYTGIVDPERCFTMELDTAVVLTPEAFVVSIQRGAEFDVTRLRAAVRAVLQAGPGAAPAPAPPRPLVPGAPGAPRRALAELCRAKPVYRLLRSDSPIRKRSVEQPAHYMHFSGRHIYEIEIENMEELVKQENGKN